MCQPEIIKLALVSFAEKKKCNSSGGKCRIFDLGCLNADKLCAKSLERFVFNISAREY